MNVHGESDRAGIDPLLSRTQRPTGTRNRRGYGTFAAFSPADRRSLQKSRTHRCSECYPEVRKLQALQRRRRRQYQHCRRGSGRGGRTPDETSSAALALFAPRMRLRCTTGDGEVSTQT